MDRLLNRRKISLLGGGVVAAGLTPTPINRNTTTVGVTTGQNKPFKVAFLYVDAIGDLGWSSAHDDGRKYLEKNVPGVETDFSENVPEGADAERVMREYAQKGFDCIVATSFGYMDPTINVAKQFPHIQFIHISGYKRANNVSTAFGQISCPRYVAGMVAGLMTKTNRLGYVAAFPIPEVIRGCNAFTLGALKTNPSVRTQVVWTNTWYDPQGERQAAQALIDQKCDVIGQHQDSAAAQEAAQAAGVYGVGYDADMASLAPKAVLTCPIWHWGVYYKMAIESMMAGTWKSNDYWGTWQQGIVDLSPFGPMVTPAAKSAAQGMIEMFRSGTMDVYDVFAGPLKDQSSKERVPAGQKMDHDAIWNMNWFVQGVDGKIPS